MKHSEEPSRIQNDISIQKIGMETLVYNERRHKAFCLNEASSIIWYLANGERSISQIAEQAALQLKTHVNEEFVIFALKTLREHGLLELAPNSQVGPAISRRTMLQRLGAGSAMLIPIVSAIVAPTAAQAYSGCVDCSSVQPARRARKQTGTTAPNP